MGHIYTNTMSTAADFKTAAPHADGFGGTRDASILASYDRIEGDFVLVQAVDRTRDLLKRAGVKRQKTHAFYPVPVRYCAAIAGLQLAGKCGSVRT